METTDGAQDGDVVYLDPPYPSDRRTHGEYGYTDWNAQALHRLVESVEVLTARGVAVVLSHSANDSILERSGVLQRYSSHNVRYQVAAKTSHRRAMKETIYLNSVASEQRGTTG